MIVGDAVTLGDGVALGSGVEVGVVLGSAVGENVAVGVADGWDRWTGGLKTFLETGQSMRFFSEGALQ